MNPIEQKRNARAFVERWKAAEGNEDREARSFWIQFAEELLGIPNATYVLDFERRVKGRKIDVFYEDMHILIENKSRGCSLDERYERSKKAGPETPYQQARWYADNLPYSIRPRWIITCNFDEIRIHDLDKENPGTDYTSVALGELPDALYLFGFFTDASNSRIEKEKRLSVKAGELVGRLYDELAKQYQNIDTDPREQRSLNVLCVRLVFLLYAEDAGLLAKRGQFYDYLRNVPPSRMRGALIDLFDVLNTPEGQRDPYLDPELAAFPYVNGGLFTHEDIVIPQLTDQIKVDLLAEASAGFDWRDISPTIFGAAFESTLNPDTRRSGGMHYTSIENIHKVIDPLFLDDLKAELAAIEGIKTERDRVRELRIFQRKLASLTFLDPAAGSHNFLTETYISLRKLELRVIENLQGDQTSFDLVDNPIMVNIGQFYAIEINDFAVSVGKTALWIAEQQMMEKTQEILPYQRFDFLPLKSITNSVCANALRIDWNDVLPAERCSYIIGNPPFLGAKIMSKEQKAEVVSLYSKVKLANSIDYVAGWYAKCAQMMDRNERIRAGLVSTNSICQGQQVAPIWGTLMTRHQMEIDFAHRSFVWNSEASDMAHVHVVIVGFSKRKLGKEKAIFDGEERLSASNINPYLCDAPDIIVDVAAKPITSDVPECDYGSLINDGGNYIFKPEELAAFLEIEPAATTYVRPLVGSDELIKGKQRFVLHLRDASETDIDGMPEVRRRVEAVRAQRAASSAEATRKTAATPHRFYFDSTCDQRFLVIPSVSSERRDYVPMDFRECDAVATNLVSIVPGAELYHFGVLSSQAHNAWMRVVAGRLKSDYRYSPKTVYNTFPWPDPTPEQKERIEQCAQAVLDTRENHPGKSLADLYDPDKMPADLLSAHKELDATVEAAYGVNFNGDEEKIVAHLFKLYAEMTQSNL